MTLQSSINTPNFNNNNNHRNTNDDDDHDHHESDADVETEDDLIENYRFLTQHCGVLRQSATTDELSTFKQQQEQQKTDQPQLKRYYSFTDGNHLDHNYKTKNDVITNNSDNANIHVGETEFSFTSNKQWSSSCNDLNNNNQDFSTTISRVPPTIYYDAVAEEECDDHQSFSITKLFTRMKAHLKHDRRYRPKPAHEILPEEDPQEWDELTKNVRTILTKVLIPDGGCTGSADRPKKTRSKRSHEHHPVLSKDSFDNDDNDDDDNNKIDCHIDDDFDLKDNEESDRIVWNRFLKCSRGLNYRRCGVCKIVDRQLFQGQLVYFYGVANNILIDENLKASGLG